MLQKISTCAVGEISESLLCIIFLYVMLKTKQYASVFSFTYISGGEKMYLELGLKYWRYHKKRAFFILFSILLSVSALVSSALLVKSNKVQQLEEHLLICGNFDFQLMNVSEMGEKKLRADKRFEKFGTVFQCGYASGNAGTDFEVGCLEDKTAEDMLHLTPIEGRYPQKSGEICIDKVTLNAMGVPAQIGQEIVLSCMDWEKNEVREAAFIVVGIIEQIVISLPGMRQSLWRILMGRRVTAKCDKELCTVLCVKVNGGI